MAMLLPPLGNFMSARLRILFKRHSWTELYHLGAGTDPFLFRNALNWLCFLRSTWLGDECFIDFASVSRGDSGRDGVAARNLPYQNPYPSLFGGPVASPDVGYQYRFEPGVGHWAYFLFRGVPARFVSGEQIVGIPFGYNPDGSLVTYQVSTADGAPNTTTPPASLPALGGATTITPAGMAFSFPLFLLGNTVKMQFSLTGAPPAPGQRAVGTWSALAWFKYSFRRIAERRAGGVFGQSKGRFAK